jgi:hypothetical protein
LSIEENLLWIQKTSEGASANGISGFKDEDMQVRILLAHGAQSLVAIAELVNAPVSTLLCLNTVVVRQFTDILDPDFPNGKSGVKAHAREAWRE